MVDEYDLVRSIVKESLYEFVKEFWDVIVPEKPVWNWHIKYPVSYTHLTLPTTPYV